MLPYELYQKIGKNLDFISVNNLQRAINCHADIDPRIYEDHPGNFICPICLHSKVNQIINEVFGMNDVHSPEFRGMRLVKNIYQKC